jgi:hypothetical protein
LTPIPNQTVKKIRASGLILFECVYLIFSLVFVEAEDISSNDDKDIFGSTHSMLFIENEANLFAVSSGISGDFKLNADHFKLESNIDLDEGTL